MMAVFPFSRVLDYERLPIDAQAVVTRARIVIAGRPNEDHPWRKNIYSQFGASIQPLEYMPAPITVEYTDPHHSTYGAERSFELPRGLDPFLPPTHPSVGNPTAGGFQNPNNVRDGNPATYALLNRSPGQDGGLQYLKTSLSSPAVGFRFAYTLNSVAPNPPVSRPLITVGLNMTRAVGANSASAIFQIGLVDSVNPAEVRLVLPPPHYPGVVEDALTSRFANVAVEARSEAEIVEMRVYEFYPLVLNMPLLEDIAKAQIRLPASNPRRVIVRGYLPPGDLTHTITGWPGGDYTGVVARQTYRDMTTIIDFEQAGAPPGVPQEAVEAERVRLNRTQALIRTAAYPNLIGTRR